MSAWRQLSIVHVSDLHFGPQHAFQPPLPPDGHPAVAKGWPKLLETLKRDWLIGTFADRGAPPTPSGFPPAARRADGRPDPNTRVVVAITGDLTETAKDTEFDDARAFIDGCSAASITGWQTRPEDIFLVPGNHDLHWGEKTPRGRWLGFSNLYGDLRQCRIDPAKPDGLTRIVDQSEQGLIVAEINSAAYIQKDVENRGQVDQAAITLLRDELDKIDAEARRRAIKVALVHHHPVQLPGLAEAKEGYSALVNSNALLERLREYGFHLILHGHKHVPFTFWYDPVCAWIGNHGYPLMIAAGGTAGSSDLGRGPGVTNTYNMITLRWDPLLQRVRIHVETRGLVRTKPDNSALDPIDWRWQTLRVSDRHFELPREAASAGVAAVREASPAEVEELEAPRQQAIHATRRNFPVIEILPSLDPQQGSEARVRIEGQIGRDDYEPPERVEWWAGPAFKNVVSVSRSEDPQFGARFTYWGPVLIQAKLHWKAGPPALAHVFAPLPADGTSR
ncbi:metallophosphoesterase [Desertibaculum subflavum]|uniref:metallophosphoesterase n=1 Tax=Desertibaculum subflavum TaxID=2268458 RepID=UPI000E66E35B